MIFYQLLCRGLVSPMKQRVKGVPNLMAPTMSALFFPFLCMSSLQFLHRWQTHSNKRFSVSNHSPVRNFLGARPVAFTDPPWCNWPHRIALWLCTWRIPAMVALVGPVNLFSKRCCKMNPLSRRGAALTRICSNSDPSGRSSKPRVVSIWGVCGSTLQTARSDSKSWRRSCWVSIYPNPGGSLPAIGVALR